MILNSAPQDQAVLSNVGQIGEFRIRNSAKAFNILSSGLTTSRPWPIYRQPIEGVLAIVPRHPSLRTFGKTKYSPKSERI
jgi:hypothetical protein